MPDGLSHYESDCNCDECNEIRDMAERAITDGGNRVSGRIRVSHTKKKQIKTIRDL